MTFAEFEALAERYWEGIPDAFKEGIDALVVARDARKPDRSNGTYTLGECVTESWPSDFDGPDTIRSVLLLYYGSFRRLAAQDDSFDWDGEVWETITHELKHNLEDSLHGTGSLEYVDAAMEQHFRRHDGEPFDPFYFRSGEPLGDGWYQLEDAFFFETGHSRDPDIVFEWADAKYRIVPPAHPSADVTFITIDGIDDAPAELVVVLVRSRSLKARLSSLLRREVPTAAELRARARRVQ